MLDHVKIKTLRAAKGLTQEAAGIAMGIPKGTARQRWNDMESGRKVNVQLDTLYKLAEVLGVEPAELLTKRGKA